MGIRFWWISMWQGRGSDIQLLKVELFLPRVQFCRIEVVRISEPGTRRGVPCLMRHPLRQN